MKHQFTTYHLIRYIYNELGILEMAAVEKALKEDASLAEQLGFLRYNQNSLKDLEINPSEGTIVNILKYSKSSNYEAELF